MAIQRLVEPEKAEVLAQSRIVKKSTKGKAPNVLTPLEKDNILLTMAEALGFYDPTP